MEAHTTAKAQASEPSAKRIRKDDAKDINEARTFLGRVQNVNKGAAKHAREDASVALDMLTTLTKADKSQFAKKVLDSKKNKDVAWVRQYRETMTTKTKTQEGAEENYYTRTGCNRQTQ